jgi:hypothetical protein
MAGKSSQKDDPDLHPDVWQRFERAMAMVVKSPSQHRTKPKARRVKSKQSPKARMGRG